MGAVQKVVENEVIEVGMRACLVLDVSVWVVWRCCFEDHYGLNRTEK